MVQLAPNRTLWVWLLELKRTFSLCSPPHGRFLNGLLPFDWLHTIIYLCCGAQLYKSGWSSMVNTVASTSCIKLHPSLPTKVSTATTLWSTVTTHKIPQTQSVQNLPFLQLFWWQIFIWSELILLQNVTISFLVWLSLKSTALWQLHLMHNHKLHIRVLDGNHAYNIWAFITSVTWGMFRIKQSLELSAATGDRGRFLSLRW